MKKWTLKFREVNRAIFEDIARGVKTVETRAATEKYRQIQSGDVIVCVCGRDQIEKSVKSVKLFGGIEELLAEIELKRVLPGVESIEDAKNIYYSFPGYEQKILDHGIIAFEL